MKARWGLIFGIIWIGPALALLSGWGRPKLFMEIKSEWIAAYLFSINQYASLFLPIVVGVFAAILCRYEHVGGGWKQLLALPVSRPQVFVSKYLIVIGLAGLMQLILFGGFILAGIIQGYKGEIPWEPLGLSIFSGWVALLPLAALQLCVSFLWKNFAAPLALNVVLSIPSILVANSETFGPWYPWAQPYLAMLSMDQSWFSVSPETFYIVILGSFLFFFWGGWISFTQRDWQ
ncbi:ABC transporter permease [Paenactinomyces guangxiensis]|uniref:ABC transporter permease n=2 Tax=Paenactinomyces guangxiensis TaxID=1490290 RepID=A0A7W1WPW4_9BACL|nr:ABC transporter permease [Paenactinomyces guangxiensis]MBA4493845.1 ABC transporter permease [Paenactinomyces guangxiensis]MBH8591311.1 ABC transporter permease [Paenactinomyces guangxiensis]